MNLTIGRKELSTTTDPPEEMYRIKSGKRVVGYYYPARNYAVVTVDKNDVFEQVDELLQKKLGASNVDITVDFD